ncbi:glycosyltransferase family 87 protein [Saccharopolyspora cebuensis]|uniref:glycosyltransferase family 87 protein n=1 Tax=Saccharopolyspora cebuensis TaxID=418759 RepID=UPI00337EE69E
MPTSEPSPGPTPRRSAAVDGESLGPADRVVPTWTEALARAASRPFGGELGRHAQVGRQWFWTPLRVILLLAVLLLAAAWLFKAPCTVTYDTDAGPQLDWRDNRQYVAMCYTDIIPRYGVGDLAPDGVFPYVTSWVENQGTAEEQVRYMEYPVLTGLFQWVNAKITDGWSTLAGLDLLPGGNSSVLYFNITAFWLAAAWLVTIWALTSLCRRRVWDAALAALSPLVFVHAFTNFDALATALGTAGLLAWARRRPVLAGVLIGLGGAAKLYPLFFLGPLLLLCLRAGRVRDGLRALTAAAASWLAVNVPLLLVAPTGWAEFFRLNSARPADPDSLYNVLMHFTGWAGFDGQLAPGAPPVVLNAVSLVLFLLACAGIGWLALAAPRRPRLAQLCFLVVAAFLLTNKVWSPQYSLWLVPLAVLALPRWRLLLAWMAVDAAIWAPRMYYYLGTGNKGLPEGWFLGAVLIRDAVVVALCVLVVREVLRPELDRVRTTLAVPSRLVPDAVDDPTGGVLDGRGDRFVLPGIPRWRHSADGDQREHLASGRH